MEKALLNSVGSSCWPCNKTNLHRETTGLNSALKLSAHILMPPMVVVVPWWKCSFPLLAVLWCFHLTLPSNGAHQHCALWCGAKSNQILQFSSSVHCTPPGLWRGTWLQIHQRPFCLFFSSCTPCVLDFHHIYLQVYTCRGPTGAVGLRRRQMTFQRLCVVRVQLIHVKILYKNVPTDIYRCLQTSFFQLCLQETLFHVALDTCPVSGVF